MLSKFGQWMLLWFPAFHAFHRQSGCAACEERWMYSLCGFEDSKNSILDSPSSIHSPAPICSPFTLRSPTRRMRNEALIEEGEEERAHTEAIGSEPPTRSTRAEFCEDGPQNTSIGGPSNRWQASKQQLHGSDSQVPLVCDGNVCQRLSICKNSLKCICSMWIWRRILGNQDKWPCKLRIHIALVHASDHSMRYFGVHTPCHVLKSKSFFGVTGPFQACGAMTTDVFWLLLVHVVCRATLGQRSSTINRNASWRRPQGPKFRTTQRSAF